MPRFLRLGSVLLFIVVAGSVLFWWFAPTKIRIIGEETRLSDQYEMEKDSTTRQTSPSSVGEVRSLPFTFLPSEGDAADWPADSARILFPERLLSVSSPRVHVFIYLPNGITPSQSPERADLPILKQSLEQVASAKDIVVFMPFPAKIGDAYPDFQLASFYEQALAILKTALPNASVIDIAVGGHGDATCEGAHAFTQSLTLPKLLGVVAYDGCLGDTITPNTFSPPSGVAFYLNPDTNGGMGTQDPATVEGTETRAMIVNRAWRLHEQPCPACVAAVGSDAKCSAPNARFTRQGGGELISFQTRRGHRESIQEMTNIAFCAMYRDASTRP